MVSGLGNNGLVHTAALEIIRETTELKLQTGNFFLWHITVNAITNSSNKYHEIQKDAQQMFLLETTAFIVFMPQFWSFFR